MTTERRHQYPGGKPVRREPYKRLPIERRPPYEPLVPGLRRPQPVNAIGFHQQRAEQSDWFKQISRE